MKKLLLLITLPLYATGVEQYSGNQFGQGFGSGGFNSQSFNAGPVNQSYNNQSQQPAANSWFANQQEIQKYITLFTQGDNSVHAAYLAMISAFQKFKTAISRYNFYVNNYTSFNKPLPKSASSLIELDQAVQDAKNAYMLSEQKFESTLKKMVNTDMIAAIKNGTFKNVMYLRMLISEYFFARAAIGISPFRTILQDTSKNTSTYPIFNGFTQNDINIFNTIVEYAQVFAQMCRYTQTILTSPQQTQNSQNNTNSFNSTQQNSSNSNALANPLNTFAGIIVQTPQLTKMPSSFFYNTTINTSFVTNQQDLPITQPCSNASSSLRPTALYTFKNNSAWDNPSNPSFMGGQITICSEQQNTTLVPVTFEITTQVVAGQTQITYIAGFGSGSTSTKQEIDILSNPTLNNQIMDFFNNAPNNPWVIIFTMNFTVDSTNTITGLSLTPQALAQLNPITAAPQLTQWQSNITGSKPVSNLLTFSTESYNKSYPLVFLPSYFYNLANPHITNSAYDLPYCYRFTAGITNGYLQTSSYQNWPDLEKAEQYVITGVDKNIQTTMINPSAIDNQLFYALKASYLALNMMYITAPAFSLLPTIIKNPQQDIPGMYIGQTNTYQPLLILPNQQSPSTQTSTTSVATNTQTESTQQMQNNTQTTTNNTQQNNQTINSVATQTEPTTNLQTSSTATGFDQQNQTVSDQTNNQNQLNEYQTNTVNNENTSTQNTGF